MAQQAVHARANVPGPQPSPSSSSADHVSDTDSEGRAQYAKRQRLRQMAATSQPSVSAASANPSPACFRAAGAPKATPSLCRAATAAPPAPCKTARASSSAPTPAPSVKASHAPSAAPRRRPASRRRLQEPAFVTERRERALAACRTGRAELGPQSARHNIVVVRPNSGAAAAAMVGGRVTVPLDGVAGAIAAAGVHGDVPRLGRDRAANATHHRARGT